MTPVNILPTAVKLARWMAWLGLACGVLYSVGGFLYDLFTTGLNGGTAMAFGALIGMPVIFATAGFALGALGAAMIGVIRQTEA
jgi:hypothetical protein